MSDRCWICERWSYYLPMVTKDEIEDCADDNIRKDQDDKPTSKLIKLNTEKEKVFDRLISLNKDTFSKLQHGVPYIIGAMTNYEFVGMKNFGDYMLSIDPDASKYNNNSRTELNSVDTHQLYCNTWQRVLKNSTSFQQSNASHRIQGHFVAAPYEVIHERSLDETFGKYTLTWAKPFFVAPGATNYFVYYRFDGVSDLKANIQTHIPLRSL